MAASMKAQRPRQRLIPGLIISVTNSARIHTGTIVMAGGNWREKMGQSRTGTSYGPLTDTPDWSYVDGRPAPLTSKREAKRRQKMRAINYRVKALLKEVNLAKLESEKKKETNREQ